jgi:UDP:flavonoid glycosyltransferase YjiC (YdhE family)
VIWISRIARSQGVQEALAAAVEGLPTLRFVVYLPAQEARAGLASHPQVRFVESVPHAWLLGRVSAAVHHGGAGTTAAVLRAGLPALVLPSWGDQTLWAQRVCALGAGPRPFHVRWVEPRLLERSLRALLDDGRYHERAREVGRSLRECPGAEAAVGELERLHAASGAQLQ